MIEWDSSFLNLDLISCILGHGIITEMYSRRKYYKSATQSCEYTAALHLR